jgi:hypothetical protein
MVGANVTLERLHLRDGSAAGGGLLRAAGGALRMVLRVAKQKPLRLGPAPPSNRRPGRPDDVPARSVCQVLCGGLRCGKRADRSRCCDALEVDDDQANDDQTPAAPCDSVAMPAVGGGGALFANGTAVVLLGNKFRNNSARSYGGGALLSFGAPFQPPPDPPAADDDTVPTPPPTPAPLGPTLLGAAVRIEGNVMEGNEGALVGAVFWGSAAGGSVRFERNDVRDCAAGAGTGAGGLGVLYLGACSVRNAHAVRGNRFARCSGGSSGSGGSGGAYHTSGGGGGGAGGFAVGYACSTADKGAAAEASNNKNATRWTGAPISDSIRQASEADPRAKTRSRPTTHSIALTTPFDQQ